MGIAELKAHLSARLREVSRGATLTVLDREKPIAQMIPFTEGAPRLATAARASGMPVIGIKKARTLSLKT